MFKWIPKTYRKFIVWFIVFQIKIFEKKEFRPLLFKWIEFKLEVITEEELNRWFTDEVYD